MKKQIGIWLGVLVVCVALLGGLGISLRKAQDQVIIIEEFSYGDKTATEGLQIWMRMRYGMQMFWDITHTMGDDGETVVRPYTQEESREMPARIRLEEVQHFSMMAGIDWGEFVTDGFVSRVYGMDEMVADVASRTADGEIHTETLIYSDYMEYYPMLPFTVNFGDTYSKEGDAYVKMDGYEMDTPAFHKAWQQFFQIPVISGDWVTISVTKDPNGDIIEETMKQSEITPGLLGYKIETEKGWFLGLNAHSEGVDTSQIAGGYGIYFLPVEEENGYRCLKPEKLSMVIPLAEGTWVRGLYTDESQKTLVVYLWENGGYWLKIYDLATMAEIQVLDLVEAGGRTSIPDIYIWDDFLLVDSNLYWLYERKESGLYEPIFRVPQKVSHENRYVGLPTGVRLQDAVIDYNGKQLLIAGWQFQETTEAAQKKDGFYLSLYDETGLVYYGLYKTSLDTGRSYEDIGYSCEPDGYDNFMVEWK